VKAPKRRRMKKLGTGYIRFGSYLKEPGYHTVSLAKKDGDTIRLNRGLLGPWKRVRLWVEVLE